MTKYISIFLFLVVGFTGYSQENELKSYVEDSTRVSPGPIEQQKNVQFTVSTGMNFSTFGKGAGATGTFFYPQATMNIGDKLNFDIGTYFLRNSFTGMDAESPYSLGYAEGFQSTSGFVNAAATYNLSEKMNITGFMMKGFGNNNQLIENYYNNLSMMGIGIDYEILPNLSIGAQFNYYNTPGRYSPYAPSFYSPMVPGIYQVPW